MEHQIQVRLCPTGVPTTDVWRAFRRVPHRGEMIVDRTVSDRHESYVVVDVTWDIDGEPFLVAHSLDRPRAEAALKYGHA